MRIETKPLGILMAEQNDKLIQHKLYKIGAELFEKRASYPIPIDKTQYIHTLHRSALNIYLARFAQLNLPIVFNSISVYIYLPMSFICSAVAYFSLLLRLVYLCRCCVVVYIEDMLSLLIAEVNGRKWGRGRYYQNRQLISCLCCSVSDACIMMHHVHRSSREMRFGIVYFPVHLSYNNCAAAILLCILD